MVGEKDGAVVVGLTDGVKVGLAEGTVVVGLTDGAEVVGLALGEKVGLADGTVVVGTTEGAEVVGCTDGERVVGTTVGGSVFGANLLRTKRLFLNLSMYLLFGCQTGSDGKNFSLSPYFSALLGTSFAFKRNGDGCLFFL